MNLPKAIEILEELPDNVNNVLDYDQQGAIKLGIEAMKREKERRRYFINSKGELLPGETEE